MKKVKNLLFALPLLIMACNNEASDSVEKADSTNEAREERADSAGTYRVDEAASNFMVKAADAGMTEVTLGELAKDRAVNKKVKDMGNMMVMDHGAANAELKTLAAARNVKLPATVGEDHQKDINDLTEKKGKDFDKAYVNHMIKAHKDAVDLFKNAADNVNDPEVKTFANNKVPKLQMHLDSFQAVKKMID